MEITATTLRRLDEFIEHDLITREVYAEVPARVEYELSEKGHIPAQFSVLCLNGLKRLILDLTID